MSRAPMVAPAILILPLVFGSPYDTQRSGAEVVRNLGRFLEQYLGDCESDDPAFDKRSCEAAAAEVRKEHQGKVLRLELDDVRDQLHLATFDQKKGAYRLHLVPFFGERALALSVGKPKRVNDEGQPVLDNVPIWVKRPEGQPELIFRRALERGQVRIELLLKPKGAYRLKRKGDTDIRGAEVALVGLRLFQESGDAPLAEQMY